MPVEALVWEANCRVGLQLNVGGIDRRFLAPRLAAVEEGLRGRGYAEVRDDVLTVEFGLMEAEAASTSLLEQYRDALLDFLGLPVAALLDQRIAAPQLTPELVEEADQIVRQIGLRAIS